MYTVYKISLENTSFQSVREISFQAIPSGGSGLNLDFIMVLPIAELADVRTCDKAGQAELQESFFYKTCRRKAASLIIELKLVTHY